ncbi:MAG: AMIN domain-containing protein [Candidatus Sulfotelmatobacter sp.]
MRIDSAFLLLLLSLVATRAPAQDAATPTEPNSPSLISSITADERATAVAIEVTFSHLVRPQVSTLEHPDRLLFEFPGCHLAGPPQRLAVNRGSLLTVRSAQFSVTPPVVRIVIDLKSPQDHEEEYVGNKLIIKFNIPGPELPSPPASAEKKAIQPPVRPAPPVPESSNPPVPTSSNLEAPTAAPPASALTAPAQFTAYTLLAKARSLAISDLEPLEARAKAGDPEAETTLALAYHAGTLLKMDDTEARRLLENAANRGFVAAEEALGMFSQSGLGAPPDKAQAVLWYTQAAQHGSRDAATNLALMYSTGDGIPKDASKAATWFRSAAEAGDATAQLNLASLYHRGQGVPQDDAQTVLWLTKAADQGLLPAMLELANWDMEPQHGNTIDDAIAWFKKAGAKGDASAQAALGDIFSDPKLGHLDYAQAVLWYRKAADQGLPAAEFGLAARYLFGQGVPEDLEEARRWLTPAANQGHPYSQFFLAKMFEAGQGGPVDLAAATKYYDLAANYGIAQAQYHLGLLLASDRSTPTSLVSAYKWLVLAQASVKESAAAAQELRKLLTPEQIAQAERQVDLWRTTHPPSRSNH